MFPLNKIHSKDSGFLVNGGLMIVAEVTDFEVTGKLDEPLEPMDVNGFHVLPSQVKSVNRLFKRDPEIAKKVRIKNQYLKTGFMNVLLSLTETVHRSPMEISKADLADAYAALESMTAYGFKLDWLEKTLDLVSVKKEKEEFGETWMHAIEEELKVFKRKCSDLEAQLDKAKAEVLAARAPLLLSDDDGDL